MFDQFYQRTELFSLVRNSCEENGLGADIHPDLLVDGFPDHERVLIIKLDAHYHSKNMVEPPPSPDYLVLVKCCNDDYEGYVIELRNVSATRNASPRVIVKKFQTVVGFIEQEFRDLFYDGDRFRLRKINLFLVTDPLRLRDRGLSDAEVRACLGTTALDAYGSLRPIELGGHPCQIEVKVPNPIIEPCH